MTSRTVLYALLHEKLQRDPLEDMRERRERGESWRAISIAYLVEQGVSVTDVTLRSWWADSEQQSASA